MEDAEIEQKFHNFCAGALSPDRAKAIWAMRDALLRDDTKFSDLAALTRAGVDAQ
jgi:hypothetical protein